MKFLYWLTSSDSLGRFKSCLFVLFVVVVLFSVCVFASLLMLNDMF